MDLPDAPLSRLAARITMAGLKVPASLLLEALSPLDVITSQLACFSRPLVGGSRAEPVVTALQDASAWAELRRLLASQD